MGEFLLQMIFSLDRGQRNTALTAQSRPPPTHVHTHVLPRATGKYVSESVTEQQLLFQQPLGPGLGGKEFNSSHTLQPGRLFSTRGNNRDFSPKC